MYAGTQKLSRKSAFDGTEARKWIVHPPSPDARQLAAALKVSPLLAQILINRGITDTNTALQFLQPKLTGLISPEKMPGVQAAIPTIKQAIKEKQKITVYGDYDVDGITGVAILWHLLTLLGADADYYIPHRIEEGYGLNTEAVRLLAKNGSKLLITVDCGISAIESADIARQSVSALSLPTTTAQALICRKLRQLSIRPSTRHTKIWIPPAQWSPSS